MTSEATVCTAAKPRSDKNILGVAYVQKMGYNLPSLQRKNPT